MWVAFNWLEIGFNSGLELNALKLPVSELE
jgi:hypothetical protein